jgi:hypothetical protein
MMQHADAPDCIATARAIAETAARERREKNASACSISPRRTSAPPMRWPPPPAEPQIFRESK